MSLARVDVRFKMNSDDHERLKAICDTAEIDINDFVEGLIVPVVRKRAHEAIALSDRLARAGISGNRREQPGVADK